MEYNNLSVVLHKKNDIRLVQIRMSRVGICGSDIHFSKTEKTGSLTVTRPYILGHKTSGIVNKVGEGVTNLQVDCVALEPLVTRRQRDKCKKGRYNLCPKIAVCGILPSDGGLTRYHVHDADLCFKLPDNVSLAEGALIEPLSVAINSAKRAGVTFGSRVLICGAGTVGLLALLVSKAFGAAQVCVTDLKENRLRVATDLGADVTLEVKTNEPRELAAIVEQAMNGKPNISLTVVVVLQYE